MSQQLERIVPCLCCNKTVLINMTSWEKCEAPYAICKPCSSSVPARLCRVLYLMRSQIASLYQELTSTKNDIKRLYSAQQDMEQALLEE